MKRFIYIFCAFLFSCDSENINDCIQAEGDIIRREFEVSAFSKIRIEDDVTLIIKEGAEQQVILETGENLLNDVSVTIEGEYLVVRDGNQCNWVRDYGITKAIITSPNITEIRNSSSFDVIGEGVLSFPKLKLVSNTTGGVEDSRKSGDFYLQLNCENIEVEANGFSAFYLTGTTEKASFTFEDEIPRLEAGNLLVDEVRIFQRSANAMIVNPLESIRGTIRGTGNVIAKNRPPIVEVEEYYTGQLLFED
tara:strand:+ start:153 stop:902 length:750 start_codon:yes stop_codon:yes gene_type:complete